MRLNIFKSNQHIYAQVGDDVAQKTLASASTLDIKADFAENKKNAGANVDASAKVRNRAFKGDFHRAGGRKHPGGAIVGASGTDGLCAL